MTQEVERNLNYTKDSSTNAGFGIAYHQAIEEGFKAGKKEFPLEEMYKQYGQSEAMIWKPKVTEMETRPGFYNFNGFQATLVREGQSPVTQFIPNYKMSGMTAEQAHLALSGATVLHTEWDRKAEERKSVYAKFDLSAKPGDGENYPVIRVNSKDLDLSRLLSKEDLVLNQGDKEELFRKLQTGDRVQVGIREKVNGVTQYPRVFLQLKLVDDKTMALSVTDREGRELRAHEQKAKEKMSETIGMVLGREGRKDLPEGILKMLKQDHSPRIPGAGKSVA